MPNDGDAIPTKSKKAGDDFQSSPVFFTKKYKKSEHIWHLFR